MTAGGIIMSGVLNCTLQCSARLSRTTSGACIGIVDTVVSYCDLHKRVLGTGEEEARWQVFEGYSQGERGSAYYPINWVQPDPARG